MSDPWMQTFTGRVFYPLNPQADEVAMIDIAHHLSLTCRFGGATVAWYSVAEHTCRMCYLMAHDGHEQAMLRHALLHDAAEAYIGDVPTPLKQTLVAGKAQGTDVLRLADHTGPVEWHSFSEIENKVREAIYEAMGIEAPTADERVTLSKYDRIMLATEKRDLLEEPRVAWGEDLPEPARRKIDEQKTYPPPVARKKFMDLAARLGLVEGEKPKPQILTPGDDA